MQGSACALQADQTMLSLTVIGGESPIQLVTRSVADGTLIKVWAEVGPEKTKTAVVALDEWETVLLKGPRRTAFQRYQFWNARLPGAACTITITVNVSWWAYRVTMGISYRSSPNISAVLRDGASSDWLTVRTKGNTLQGIVRWGTESQLRTNEYTSLSMPKSSDSLDYDHFELEFFDQDKSSWFVCAGSKVNGCAPISYIFSLDPDGNANLDSQRSEYGLHVVIANMPENPLFFRLKNQNSGEIITVPISLSEPYANGYIPIYGVGQTREGDPIVLQVKGLLFSSWHDVQNATVAMPPWGQGGQCVLTLLEWNRGSEPTGSAGVLAPPWYYGNNCSRFYYDPPRFL